MYLIKEAISSLPIVCFYPSNNYSLLQTYFFVIVQTIDNCHLNVDLNHISFIIYSSEFTGGKDFYLHFGSLKE